MGMSYELYWFGDPWLTRAYKKAYELGIQRRNEELWLQGLYNYNAFATVLSNIHLDGKPHRQNKYLEKPIDLFEKTESEEKVEAQKAEQKVIDFFNSFMKNFNAKKGKADG